LNKSKKILIIDKNKNYIFFFILARLRGPPKGLLLFGPPGTGKTLIGKKKFNKKNICFNDVL